VNGPYKLLAPELRREEQKRMRFLNLRDFPSLGEKVARIQSTLDPVYAAGRLFVAKHHKLQLEEEKRAFPQSRKKDILDALSSAITNSFRPMNEKENELKRLADEGFRNRHTSPWGGY
jgi:phage terminase large subunit-like protein